MTGQLCIYAAKEKPFIQHMISVSMQDIIRAANVCERTRLTSTVLKVTFDEYYKFNEESYVTSTDITNEFLDYGKLPCGASL